MKTWARQEKQLRLLGFFFFVIAFCVKYLFVLFAVVLVCAVFK